MCRNTKTGINTVMNGCFRVKLKKDSKTMSRNLTGLRVRCSPKCCEIEVCPLEALNHLPSEPRLVSVTAWKPGCRG